MRIIALLTLLMAAPAFANPVNPVIEGGEFTRLEVGEPAKFHSWCYDDFANSQIISKITFANKHCELKIEHELEKERARLNLTINNLQLRVDTLKEQNEEIIRIKDKEIDKLTEIVSKVPNDYSVWWASGGFVAGVVVSILIFSAAK
jgi:flagellar motility protein MotE (MotC chaperone)